MTVFICDAGSTTWSTPKGCTGACPVHSPKPLCIDTTSRSAKATRDDLTNSYSSYSLGRHSDHARRARRAWSLWSVTAYKYWPRLDSVSMALDALDDLPVTRVRI